MTSHPATLERKLGLTDATMLVVGSMIGSGIFIVSAESARLVGSPGFLLLAWALAGVMTIAGALCCAELAAAIPRAGGQYVFLREAYGPATGFVFGWSFLLVIQTGTIAAVAVAFANFSGILIPSISSTSYLVEPIRIGHCAISFSTQQATAIAMILLLTLLNARGLVLGKWIQNTFTTAKTAALLGLIVACLALGWKLRGAAFTSSWWNPTDNGWTAQVAQPGLGVVGALALVMLLGKAMVGPLFSQSAWNNVTFIGAEVRDPGRNLPRALLIGCSLVVGLYLLANLGYVVALSLDQIQRAPQNRVGTAAMQAVLGDRGTVLMAAAIMVSTFGCANGLILSGARISYAMARDGLFFARAGRVNRYHVPGAALVGQGVWASLLTLPRTAREDAAGSVVYGNVYTQLLEYLVPADLVLYALMVAAVIVLRRKMPAMDRPYRTWGYPIVPAVYIGLALFLVVDLLYVAPATSGVGYAIVLAGFPVYFLWRRVTVRTADAP
ncbi:MAG TPA: amino acid permease [Candidatus Krumholzibacteria bacterium]|nr:amino acid permease [Candidatus Krumholzibacteria bacterium]